MSLEYATALLGSKILLSQMASSYPAIASTLGALKYGAPIAAAAAGLGEWWSGNDWSGGGGGASGAASGGGGGGGDRPYVRIPTGAGIRTTRARPRYRRYGYRVAAGGGGGGRPPPGGSGTAAGRFGRRRRTNWKKWGKVAWKVGSGAYAAYKRAAKLNAARKRRERRYSANADSAARPQSYARGYYGNVYWVTRRKKYRRFKTRKNFYRY